MFEPWFSSWNHIMMIATIQQKQTICYYFHLYQWLGSYLPARFLLKLLISFWSSHALIRSISSVTTSLSLLLTLLFLLNSTFIFVSFHQLICNIQWILLPKQAWIINKLFHIEYLPESSFHFLMLLQLFVSNAKFLEYCFLSSTILLSVIVVNVYLLIHETICGPSHHMLHFNHFAVSIPLLTISAGFSWLLT